MSFLPRGRLLAASVLLASLAAGPGSARSQDAPPPESNYVKLLKKAPEARLGAIIEVVGKRGDAADLTYLLSRATAFEPAGFAAANRRLAFEVLADAAATRDVRPTAGLDDLNPWIGSGPGADAAARLAAIRLAGAYRSASAIAPLIEEAGGKSGDPAARSEALAALAAIGDDEAKAALARFAAPTEPAAVRSAAVAGLARIDLAAAADRAAEIIAASAENQDLAPLVAPFLDRKGGPDQLLAAIDRHPPGADGAKLALRAISARGRSDEALIARLGRIAGIEGDPRPPGPAEMAALVADVASHGDPARGERIFRRPELNCMSCHAIAGAAGGVGPELSAVGLSSPVDYIVNSILIPDQAIKEEYQTRVVQTVDGRVLQGIVVEEDDRRVVLKDAQAERLVVPAASIEESKKGGSLMPRGLVATLTHAEFVDLVRFVSELGRPGPYALRPTPTIQRWRALRPVPPALGGLAPPPAADVRAAVLDADPARWLPIYAWAGGDLPIPDLLATVGGQVGVVRGEFVVTAAGPIGLRFGRKARPDLAAWVNEQPVEIGPDGSVALTFAPGVQRVTVRVAAQPGLDPSDPIRVEVVRLGGSPAEFSVVGGR